MAHAVLLQPDCITAWLNATSWVDAQSGHEAYDVMIEITDPTAGSNGNDPGVALVNAFLTSMTNTKGKPIETVANTIFPQTTYHRHGYPAFFDIFDRILPKLAKSGNWSGYYFERMTTHHDHTGRRRNPLRELIERLVNPKVKSRNKFELPIFDLDRDVNLSPYGGQCLSHLSFKATQDGRLNLTCAYRNHYYIEKLLGNLIGLGRLQAFVAEQAKLEIGTLVIVSTHAEVDTLGGGRGPIKTLLSEVASALEPERVR